MYVLYIHANKSHFSEHCDVYYALKFVKYAL